MNNKDFQRLVSDTPRHPQNGSPSGTTKPHQTPSAFGSKTKSSIPMTPRTIKGSPSIDFARQLSDHTFHPSKKFRSSAPRGSRLAEGYRDRVQDRLRQDEDAQVALDDREARVRALEEQMKLGQISQATFEQLRDQITGGDPGATHLVKGLDRRLLERVRRGEDVLSVGGEGGDELERGEDEELEALERHDVAPVQREEKVEKKGSMAAPPAPVAGVKRSRNDILAELKKSRQAARESQPQLGPRFRKIGAKQEKGTSRLERDEKGREVLITVDQDGKVKKKVRNVASGQPHSGLLMPNKAAAPLGLEVPEQPPAAATDDDEADGDIFEGVGDEYDPFKDEDAGDSSDTDMPEAQVTKSESKTSAPANTALENAHADREGGSPSTSRSSSPASDAELESSKTSMPPPPKPSSAKRDYFNEKATSDTPSSAEDTKPAPFSDPAILATLKRAAALKAASEHDRGEQKVDEKGPKPSSAAQRLLQRDRDLDDLDMGFGSSRAGDEEDAEAEGKRIKLSEWGGLGGGDDVEARDQKQRGGQQRKRGKKKKKGDKDSASDVMRVIEGRKGGR